MNVSSIITQLRLDTYAKCKYTNVPNLRQCAQFHFIMQPASCCITEVLVKMHLNRCFLWSPKILCEQSGLSDILNTHRASVDDEGTQPASASSRDLI